MGYLFTLIYYLLEIYSFALIIYILMSWVPNIRYSAFGQFLGKICEPYLEPFRRVIPPIGMMDLSPMVAFLVLYFARIGLMQLSYYF